MDEVEALRDENRRLRERLATLERSETSTSTEALENPTGFHNGLSFGEFGRYGRQMVVPEFGSLAGQLALKRSRVLVVGAGGLGCPALAYLAGAGVGTIGIVDGDEVDETNLHRQILHTTGSVGHLKCNSAREYLEKLNPCIEIVTFPLRLTNFNAIEIAAKFDLVLDCTDSPASRYLVSDAAVVCGIPVVSGSGVRTEGQLSVFNFENGPCYRCFYPDPPAANSITSCSEGGVIGPAIGLVGTAMAVEAIKVLSGYYSGRLKPFLSMYSAYPNQTLRMFKMRGKQPNCLCHTLNADTVGQTDYSEFCGAISVANVLQQGHQVSVHEYRDSRKSDHVLLDVRPKEQFDISSLPGSLNIPWESFSKKNGEELLHMFSHKDVFVVCRHGNDSQLATKMLVEQGVNAKDVRGGLSRWFREVDQEIPFY